MAQAQTKLGRKRQPGERYPSGKLKQYTSPKDIRFVYVMQEDGGSAVKIGVSNNPARRVSELHLTYERHFHIIWHIGVKFDDGMRLEQAAHRRLKRTACHMRGELYIIDPETAVAAIKGAAEILGIEPLKQMQEIDAEADRVANYRRGLSVRSMGALSSLRPLGGF